MKANPLRDYFDRNPRTREFLYGEPGARGFVRDLVIFSAGLAIGCFAIGYAHAETPYAVRDQPGLSCMLVAVPDAPGLRNGQKGGVPDWSALPHILAAPQASAQPIGLASSIALAVSPPHVVNGFTEIRTFANGPGWLPSDSLKPYKSASLPNAKCVPTLLSNGGLGMTNG